MAGQVQAVAQRPAGIGARGAEAASGDGDAIESTSETPAAGSTARSRTRSSNTVTNTSSAIVRALAISPARVSSPRSLSRATTARKENDGSPSTRPTLLSSDTTWTGPAMWRGWPRRPRAVSKARSSTSARTPLARSHPLVTRSSRRPATRAEGNGSPAVRRRTRCLARSLRWMRTLMGALGGWGNRRPGSHRACPERVSAGIDRSRRPRRRRRCRGREAPSGCRA